MKPPSYIPIILHYINKKAHMIHLKKEMYIAHTIVYHFKQQSEKKQNRSMVLPSLVYQETRTHLHPMLWAALQENESLTSILESLRRKLGKLS